MNLYAFATKTLFDPARGVSINAFGSKTDYLKIAPIKVLSFCGATRHVTQPDLFLYNCNSFVGDEGARAAVGQTLVHGTPEDLVITHTDFHSAALQTRLGVIMPGKLVLIDELARQVNPAQRAVNLNKLAQLYAPADLQRLPCDFVEGMHTEEQLVAANERDACIMLVVYQRLAGLLNEATALNRATSAAKN